MSDDFLVRQLAACAPLEFVRLWAPSAIGGQYELVVEAIREDPDGCTFSAPAATATPALSDAGRWSSETWNPEEIAAKVYEVLAALGKEKVSLTHGTRDELVQRRRVEAAVADVNRIFATELMADSWTADLEPPIHIGVGGRNVSLEPRLMFDTVMLQAVVPVATGLPEDRPELPEIIRRANEALIVGRFVRNGDTLEFRDLIPAEPVTTNALRTLLVVSARTADQYAAPFVELGATDAGSPTDNPSPTSERPNFTYL